MVICVLYFEKNISLREGYEKFSICIIWVMIKGDKSVKIGEEKI